MSKNIIKEIIIVLLLSILIILVLGVILYNYVPANKQIPAEISYTTPKNVKTELQSVDGADEDKIILTYKIDQTDLYNYQRVRDYKPGKTNPFSTYKTQDVEKSSEKGSNSQQSSSSQTSKNETSNSTTDPINTVNPGNYTQNKGLK